jgi:hypothetical protein
VRRTINISARYVKRGIEEFDNVPVLHPAHFFAHMCKYTLIFGESVHIYAQIYAINAKICTTKKYTGAQQYATKSCRKICTPQKKYIHKIKFASVFYKN